MARTKGAKNVDRINPKTQPIEQKLVEEKVLYQRSWQRDYFFTHDISNIEFKHFFKQKGISETTAIRIWRGRGQNLSYSTMKAIREFTGVSYDEMYGINVPAQADERYEYARIFNIFLSQNKTTDAFEYLCERYNETLKSDIDMLLEPTDRENTAIPGLLRRFERLKKDNDLTIYEVTLGANISGVANITPYKFLTQGVREKRLLEYCTLFGCSLDYLLGDYKVNTNELTGKVDKTDDLYIMLREVSTEDYKRIEHILISQMRKEILESNK